MPSVKSDKYLKRILSYVKFPFDRYAIEDELKNHLLDKIDDYVAEGYDEETAEQLAIADMGEAELIGVELNKQHNPFIGWLWEITNVVLVLILLVNIYLVGIPLVMSLLSIDSPKDIPKENIVYSLDINKKVKLDDTVIDFTQLVYEQNGDMNIYYKYYDTRLWGTGWGLGSIGHIADNLGNSYSAGTGSINGGIVSRGVRTVHNFSTEADTLIISYDNYNRSYNVEIPLKAGTANE